MSAFGHIDILVCNAASNPYYGPLSGIQDEQFRKVLDNNILANHWPVQLVSPLMIEPARRSMIIISSIGGLHRSAVLGNPQTLDRKLAMTPLKLRSHAARVNASRLASGPHFVEYDVPTPDSRPGGMVIGPDGNVWFIESIGNILGRIYADDQITEFPIPTPNANLTRATTA